MAWRNHRSFEGKRKVNQLSSRQRTVRTDGSRQDHDDLDGCNRSCAVTHVALGKESPRERRVSGLKYAGPGRNQSLQMTWADLQRNYGCFRGLTDVNWLEITVWRSAPCERMIFWGPRSVALCERSIFSWVRQNREWRSLNLQRIARSSWTSGCCLTEFNLWWGKKHSGSLDVRSEPPAAPRTQFLFPSDRSPICGYYEWCQRDRNPRRLISRVGRDFFGCGVVPDIERLIGGCGLWQGRFCTRRCASDSPWFRRGCQRSIGIFLRITRLIEARYPGAVVGICLDIGSDSVAIPTNSDRMLILCSLAESLRIPDWTEIARTPDFRFYANLCEVIAGLQREIDCFRDCRKLERIELSRSAEIAGWNAFSTDKGEDSSDAETLRARSPIFLTVGDESQLRRSWRGSDICITGKKGRKPPRCLFPSDFAADREVRQQRPQKGVIDVTPSSAYGRDFFRKGPDLGSYSKFCSEDNQGTGFVLTSRGPGSSQRVSSSGRTGLSSEEYGNRGLGWRGFADGNWLAREQQQPQGPLALKTYAISPSASFRMIRLH